MWSFFCVAPNFSHQSFLSSSNLGLYLLGTCRYDCVRQYDFMRSFIFLALKFTLWWHVHNVRHHRLFELNIIFPALTPYAISFSLIDCWSIRHKSYTVWWNNPPPTHTITHTDTQEANSMYFISLIMKKNNLRLVLRSSVTTLNRGILS